MSSYGPNINNNGLLFAIDSANAKSYVTGSTDVFDMINKPQSGSLINGVSYSDNVWGFDGTDDQLLILTDGSGSMFETQEFTIDVWCKYSGGIYNTCWSFDNLTNNPPYYAQHIRIESAADRVVFGSNRGGTLQEIKSLGGSLVEGEWHNIVCTKTRTKQIIYINGVNVKQETFASTDITYYNQEVWVGRGNSSTMWFSGDMAITKFYNKVLTPQQVEQNFNALKHRFGLR